MRYWLPLVAALVCLYVASKTASPLVAFVLIIAAFGLVIEVSSRLLGNAGKAGGLHDHRQ